MVDFEESYSDGSYTYYPIVEYGLPNSFEVYQFKHHTGSNPPSFQIGEEVEVLYNPDDFTDAIIDQGLFNYFWPALIIFFGFFFGSIGISTTKLALNRKKYLRLCGA